VGLRASVNVWPRGNCASVGNGVTDRIRRPVYVNLRYVKPGQSYCEVTAQIMKLALGVQYFEDKVADCKKV